MKYLIGKSGQTEHLIPEQTEQPNPVQSEQSKIKDLPGY